MGVQPLRHPTTPKRMQELMSLPFPMHSGAQPTVHGTAAQLHSSDQLVGTSDAGQDNTMEERSRINADIVIMPLAQ